METSTKSTRFEEFWELHPNGNKKDVEIAYCYALYKEVTEETLITKMKQYRDMCKAEKREAKYIQGPENWLTQEKYLQEFNKASGSTMNFIEKWLEGLL